ncbi:hypothetical protein [Bradyrhizobium sp. dw_411]|uniref:hypothetical protein n=1 Tax=Bradyrhizobium sp. dw_411 TaxID=2720082 RepID=UPI001BCE9A14|nr:hypothetical protein [Bradyrhizobium sp. dw_411]
MAKPPTSEFGKRKPAVAPAAAPPVKRSGHVALLLMGTVAIGGGAYAVMPRNNCQPASPGMAAPASPGMATSPSPQTAVNCTTRGYSSGGGSSGWSRRSSFFGDFGSNSSSGMASGSSSSSSGTASGSSSVTRGGFGSFAHGFAGHFGG